MTARQSMRAAERDPFPQILPAGCDQQGRYITRGEAMMQSFDIAWRQPLPDPATLPVIPCSTAARVIQSAESWLMTARGGLLVCAVSAVAVIATAAACWPH